ncbi:hypothetical protein Salat_0182400 [Sesamum alatum]|uniref:Retrovirus-related Pol polyprotein from transposon TNT 1-94-like beta-barrel domain-containing protein n=1 Tax=Sesamum alatum TaxID=300844 RepID=A0AAE1YZB4_9LAMI|nr:hypothetical protein Salat_0182400 [Sesamum alatum]
MIRGRDDQIEAIAMAVTTPGRGKGFSQSRPKQHGKRGREQPRGQGQVGHSQANVATTGGTVEGSSNDRISGLSAEQFQKLLNILDRSSDGTERLSGKVTQPSIWILDSGASNHMTGRKELLSELIDTIPMPVYLPNGARTTTTMVGRVVLSPKMELANVIYVPKLTCNLISIRQLIFALNLPNNVY